MKSEEKSQGVKIGTEVSELIFVDHGVPQGTVLGPLINFYTLTIVHKKSKVTLSLFNLQTILVFYVNMNQEKQLQPKIKNIILKADSYLKENQLTLNADKTELHYFSLRDELEPKVNLNGNLITSAESCRCLRILLDSKLTIEAHLNVFLKQMAAAV